MIKPEYEQYIDRTGKAIEKLSQDFADQFAKKDDFNMIGMTFKVDGSDDINVTIKKAGYRPPSESVKRDDQLVMQFYQTVLWQCALTNVHPARMNCFLDGGTAKTIKSLNGWAGISFPPITMDQAIELAKTMTYDKDTIFKALSL